MQNSSLFKNPNVKTWLWVKAFFAKGRITEQILVFDILGRICNAGGANIWITTCLHNILAFRIDLRYQFNPTQGTLRYFHDTAFTKVDCKYVKTIGRETETKLQGIQVTVDDNMKNCTGHRIPDRNLTSFHWKSINF